MNTSFAKRGPFSLNASVAILSTVVFVAFSLAARVSALAQDQAPPSAGAPYGWTLQGDHPQNYITGIDQDERNQGHPSAYLRAKPTATLGFGTLMQQFDAKQYAGKRVRFSAWVKAQDVTDGAGLWMRVDDSSHSVAFDNMQNRPIKGTSDWHNYSVVLDVPQNATGIFYGILLTRSGNVWLNSAKFEIVGNDVPVTDMWAGRSARLDGPTNLNFEQ
jgi:hypothetical protein